MINTSTEYKKTVFDRRKFSIKGTILLKNGEVLQLDSSKVVQGGCKITDSTSRQNEFCIGSAVANKLTLSLNNMYDEYSDYDFTDAVITIFVGLQLENKIEWLKKGVFISEDPTTTSSVLTLEALDNMSKLDKAYDRSLSFPCNLRTIVQYCCDKCGVQLSTMQFPNYSYIVAESPFEDDSNDITYRAILSYCAMISCCFARCNADGLMELRWYDTKAFDELNKYDGGFFDQTDKEIYQTGDALDGGDFKDYTSGDAAEGGSFVEDLKFHNIYSLSSMDVSTEDVVITGIKVKAIDGVTSAGKKLEGETYLCGAEGYVLSISNNPLIRYGKAKEIATYIGGKVIGMRFRPLKANALGDPSWEAGDPAVVTDRKNNSYQCYITNLSYGIGVYASFQSDAEPAKRHSVDRYSELSKIVADIKKDSQQELDFYTQYVERMNQLAVNSMGYYQTTDELDDGSLITYMHDKPLLKDSKIVYKKTIDGFFWSKDGGKTYTGGIDKNGNAVMNVIATIGLQADWINTGRFTAKDAKGTTKFLVDADTGLVEIRPDTFLLEGKTVDEIAKGEADLAVSALDKELTATEVFNRLTNNGQSQGIYLKDGKIYINLTYAKAGTIVASLIKGGTLTLGGDNNANGNMKILDSNGTVAGKWDNTGLTAKSLTANDYIYVDGNTLSMFKIHDLLKINMDGILLKPWGGLCFDMRGKVFKALCVSAHEDNRNEHGVVFNDFGVTVSYNKNDWNPLGGSDTHYKGAFIRSTYIEVIDGAFMGDNYTHFSASGIYTTGSKNRIVNTSDYGKRKLYCYEMPSPAFGDYGSGVIGEDGVCYVYIEPIFSESIEQKYEVFLSKYGAGDVWADQVESSYFIVKGTPGLKFAWEVKAKQRGYAMERLDVFEHENNSKKVDYGAEGLNYLIDYRKEITG